MPQLPTSSESKPRFGSVDVTSGDESDEWLKVHRPNPASAPKPATHSWHGGSSRSLPASAFVKGTELSGRIATQAAIIRLEEATNKSSMSKKKSIFSNQQPDQTLPEAEETLSRLSYYTAKRPKVTHPARDQPALTTPKDLSAPVSFVEQVERPVSVVEAAEQEANASGYVAASLDGIYEEVLAGPAVFMTPEHFSCATDEDKIKHGIPLNKGEWWFILQPRIDIPINNRCKMALQGYLVSEVVVLLAAVLKHDEWREARSSLPTPSLNSIEEDEVMDSTKRGIQYSSAYSVEDLRVIISEYAIAREVLHTEAMVSVEKRGVKAPKKTNPSTNPKQDKGWGWTSGERTGIGAKEPKAFGFLEAGCESVRGCQRCLMLNTKTADKCKSCKGPLGPCFTTACLPEYRTSTGLHMRLEHTEMGIVWMIKNPDYGSSKLQELTASIKETFAQNVSDFAQVAPGPKSGANFTWSDWCPNDLSVRAISNYEAHKHDNGRLDNPELQPPSGPTMGFHPDLTLQANPTANSLVERFRALDQATQDEVGGAFEDFTALGQGAQDNPQEEDNPQEVEDPEAEFFKKPYIKRLLKNLQGTGLADLLLREGDIHAGITRDQLLLAARDMEACSDTHKEKTMLQKMFYRKHDNKSPETRIAKEVWNNSHQLMFETQYCAIGQWLQDLQQGDIAESNRRFKVMKHHLGDMLMSNHQVHNFMGAHFWSELPDVTSYSYGEAEAMSDEWKIHLLMDVLKRHWAETKSTAGVWKLYHGKPVLPKACFKPVKNKEAGSSEATVNSSDTQLECIFTGHRPPSTYLSKDEREDFKNLEPFTWPIHESPNCMQAFRDSQCRYQPWELSQHAYDGKRPWAEDCTSLHKALLRNETWQYTQHEDTYSTEYYFLRHCHQFDLTELITLHGGRFTFRQIYNFFIALPIARRVNERDNKAQRALLARRMEPGSEDSVVSVFEAAGVARPSEGLSRRCSIRLLGRFITADAFLPPSIKELKQVPVAVERDDGQTQWLRAMCDPEIMISYSRLFDNFPDLAKQAGLAVGGCLLARFNYRCTKSRQWTAPIVCPKALLKIHLSLNSAAFPGWGPHDPTNLQLAYWIIRDFQVIPHRPDGNGNKDWDFHSWSKKPENVQRAKQCSEHFLAEMLKEKAQGKLEAPVQRCWGTTKDGQQLLLPPSSHLNVSGACSRTWAKTMNREQVIKEAGGIVLPVLSEYCYFWFTLFCGMVLPNVSGWETFLKEQGVHSHNKFVCRHCVEEWGGGDDGSMMLTIYGLRNQHQFKVLSQAVAEARSSASTSDQGSAGPSFKFQALQCIVNFPPQSLWDRFINNKMAYQERFAPHGALKDTPVDPNLKPEDRIDCTGKDLSDFLWTLVLEPAESDASRNLRSLASVAISRLLKEK